MGKLKIDLVQGSHILLEGRLTQGIYYIESPRDRRPVLVMPWQNKILVGTTERNYFGDPASVKPLDDEKHYLLETLSNYFPAYNTFNKRNIVSSFAGLRVLQANSELTGEDLLARALCHETDHLNGRLFISHLGSLRRDLIKRKVRKLMRAGEW